MIKLLIVLHSFIFLGCFMPAAQAQPLFQNASQESGINLLSESFGAGAWGDYNGDTLPDFWLGNHRSPPSLFVNQGNGSFIDVASLVVQLPFPSDIIDAHGAQWADLDRDGDMDLIELTGALTGLSSEASFVWMNQAGQLVDQAVSLGLSYPTCRG